LTANDDIRNHFTGSPHGRLLVSIPSTSSIELGRSYGPENDMFAARIIFASSPWSKPRPYHRPGSVATARKRQVNNLEASACLAQLA
jgi:hypothetical protein